MASLVIFGYLMCNVLLAWATLHKPNIPNSRQTLSSPPPQNKNEWVHSVIFEPQPKIQLTRSSYKVTSFLDFQPFLRSFQSVGDYIRDLVKDINNPEYCQRVVYSIKIILYLHYQISWIYKDFLFAYVCFSSCLT